MLSIIVISGFNFLFQNIEHFNFGSLKPILISCYNTFISNQISSTIFNAVENDCSEFQCQLIPSNALRTTGVLSVHQEAVNHLGTGIPGLELVSVYQRVWPLQQHVNSYLFINTRTNKKYMMHLITY